MAEELHSSAAMPFFALVERIRNRVQEMPGSVQEMPARTDDDLYWQYGVHEA
jgi:hypothetical protein